MEEKSFSNFFFFHSYSLGLIDKSSTKKGNIARAEEVFKAGNMTLHDKNTLDLVKINRVGKSFFYHKTY